MTKNKANIKEGIFKTCIMRKKESLAKGIFVDSSSRCRFCSWLLEFGIDFRFAKGMRRRMQLICDSNNTKFIKKQICHLLLVAATQMSQKNRKITQR